MGNPECYRVLGLDINATSAQVRRAYKHLALRHHPDRTASDPDSLALFCRVTEAYAILRGGLRHRQPARSQCTCPKCGRVARLLKGLDGRAFCANCLLPGRRRLLPLPRFETIRCSAAIVLQGLALYCTVVSAVSTDWRYGAAGACLVLAAIGTLAHSVWTADVIDR